jgi:hypothetical protein
MAHAPASKPEPDKHHDSRHPDSRHEVTGAAADPDSEEGLTIGEIQRRNSDKREAERVANATAEMAKKK